MPNSYGPNLGKLINALTGAPFDVDFRFLLRAFDILIQPNVISMSLSTPPGSPTNGDRYVIGSSPSGAWVGQAVGTIMVWTTDNPASPSGVWENYVPKSGWSVFNLADSTAYRWNGSAWVHASSSMLPVYTVSGLPASPAAGSIAYASNGVKVGETTGGGTGVPVYFSNSQWRRYSDDTQVIS